MAPLVLLLGATMVAGRCPFSHQPSDREASNEWTVLKSDRSMASRSVEAATRELDWEAVRADLTVFMTDSKPEWPADYGHYGPLMVRLAWHASGSYRRSDGRGGIDGARQRFEPERSWDDNTNLDKARALLWPIKQKYGPGLSWGDLIVLAGNTAIESMGLELLGFCAGRLDDQNGDDSRLLGPTPEQEDQIPCDTQGACEEPLGTSTVGLIYVNPEGPLGNPVPALSVADIRDTFDRMSMNDWETVALIGGGHAFGKTHGACPTGPGDKPVDDPVNPWPGTCSSGKGEDAFTSGFEFPWTTNPIRWDNEYFSNILTYKWEKWIGPGGHNQWQVTEPSSPVAPSASGNSTQPIGMLTTDLALKEDPAYLELAQLYASNIEVFDHDFKRAWYKLTTRDMGPHSRCMGPLVPPPQPWQYPLPDPPAMLPDFVMVKYEVEALIADDPLARNALVRLAWRCAATFRTTDYLGGCNGARVRLDPQAHWPVNAGLDHALALLEPTKALFGPTLSWSDLIVLAGGVAVQLATGFHVHFCGGRTDAERDAGASDYLQPRVTGVMTDSVEQLKDAAMVMGLSHREFAALNGLGYVLGGEHGTCLGLFCRRDDHTDSRPQLDNQFFVTLLTESWEESTDPANGRPLYKAVGSDRMMFATDLWYRSDGELRAIAEEYAFDNDKFVHDAVMTWGKLMAADRFDGPAGNLCNL